MRPIHVAVVFVLMLLLSSCAGVGNELTEARAQKA